MSLATKIDEVAVFLDKERSDLVFITETWLRDSITDDHVSISGYQLFRKDRRTKTHGGVCLYVKNSIQCKVLDALYSDNLEVL